MTLFKELQHNWICLCLWAHLCPKGTMATVSSPTAQEPEAIVCKHKGGTSVQGALLCLSLNLRRKHCWLAWSLCKSMWMTPNEFTAVMSRDVQRDLQPSEWQYVLTCAGPVWVQNYHAPHVPVPFSTPMSSISMASGHIPLGPQTPFKSIVLLFCYNKKLVSLGSVLEFMPEIAPSKAPCYTL